MKTPENIFLMQQIYATLFSLANKVQIYSDTSLDGLTSRQLMTMIATEHESTLINIAKAWDN